MGREYKWKYEKDKINALRCNDKERANKENIVQMMVTFKQAFS